MKNCMRMQVAARWEVITRAWMVSSDTSASRFKRYTSAFTIQPHLFGLLDPSSITFVLNSSEDFNIFEGLDEELHESASRCQVGIDNQSLDGLF